MATTLRAFQNSSSTGTALSVATDALQGELVVCIAHANGQTTLVDNNGATPLTEDINDYKPNTTNGHTMSIFSRRLIAGDPTTFNFTSGATGRWGVVCIIIKDPNPDAIYDVAPTTDVGTSNRDSSGDGTAVTEAITTIQNGAINIVCAGWDTGAIGTITTPSGYTLLDNANGGGEPTHASYKAIPVAGSTGTQNIVNTEFGAYITFSFSIKINVNLAPSAIGNPFHPGSGVLNMARFYQSPRDTSVSAVVTDIYNAMRTMMGMGL